ncbi:hypothetical protein H7X87_01760 [Acetobacteraceae bacterium]|nr:hypothetical protein [Candidatus Parcubacteria bacterium]
MINQDVLNYIRGQIALGVSRDVIKKSLSTGGWSEADMVEAFAAIDGIRMPPPPVPAPPPPPPIQPISSPVAQSSIQQRPVPGVSTISTAPVRRRSVWPWILLILLLIIVGLAAAIYFWYPSIVDKYFGTEAPPAPIVEQQPAPVQNNTTVNINVPVASSTGTTTTTTTTTTSTTTATTTR